MTRFHTLINSPEFILTLVESDRVFRLVATTTESQHLRAGDLAVIVARLIRILDETNRLDTNLSRLSQDYEMPSFSLGRLFPKITVEDGLGPVITGSTIITEYPVPCRTCEGTTSYIRSGQEFCSGCDQPR